MFLLLAFQQMQGIAQGPDCSQAALLCSDAAISFTPQGPGISDATDWGCLYGEHESVWYKIQLNNCTPAGAELGFTLTPAGGGSQDYDFAVFSANNDCGNLGSPIRCSFAAPNSGVLTGMGAGASDVSENAGGDGFVAPLIVQPGESYFILIDNWSNNTVGFSMEWTGSAKSFLLCDNCTLTAAAGSDLSACKSQEIISMTLSSSYGGSQGSVTIQWDGPFLENPNLPNPVINIPEGFEGVLNYAITINDCACSKQDYMSVTIFPSPEFTLVAENPICQQDGKIWAENIVAPAPYTYNWSTGASIPQITGLSDGEYTLTLTDGHSCTASKTISIIGPPQLSVQIGESIPAQCFGSADGSAFVVANGGTAPYSFLWANGQASSQLTNVAAGDHYVTVTDINGCMAVQSAIIGQPAPLEATFSPTMVSCFEGYDGALVVDSTWGGTQSYFYSLDGFSYSSNPGFVNLVAGTYTAFVVDAHGCEWEQQYTITQPPFATAIDLGEEVTVILGHEVELKPNIIYANGRIEKTLWFPEICLDCLDTVLIPLHTQEYSLTITDQNGCTASDTKLVRVDKQRKVFVPNAFSPNEDGINDQLLVFSDKSVAEVMSFQVYNRWGTMLYEESGFQSNDPNIGWNGSIDGQPAPLGIYVFALKIKYIDGFVEVLSGDVMLIR